MARREEFETIEKCLGYTMTVAIEKIFPEDQYGELKSFAKWYRDIFRTSLGAGVPFKFYIMAIKLKQDENPVRVKLRRYSPSQLEFIRNKIKLYKNLGIVYMNDTRT